MSKPRVLLTNFHPGDGGGHTTYLQRLLAAGLQEQFEVAVAAPENSRILRWVRQAGHRAYACDFPGGILEGPAIFRAIRRLSQIYQEFPFAILHSNGSRDQTLAGWWLRITNAPPRLVRTHHAIRQVHDDCYHRWLHHRQTASHIYVAHAQANINEAGKALRCPNSHVIANGVDLQAFAPTPKSELLLQELEIAPGQLVFGSVGGTAPHKRVDVMLRALALVPARERAVIIALGGESGGRQLCELAHELKVATQFRFVGHQADVRPYVSLFDVGFLLSDRESSPFSAREMMAMGAPLLCSGFAGMIELVEEGVSGYITRVGDCREVARRVEEFLTMPAPHLKTFQTAARAKAIRSFNQQEMVRKTCAVYTQVLSE